VDLGEKSMKEARLSCKGKIKQDYIAKHGRFSLFNFLMRYIFDTAVFATANYRVAKYLQSIGHRSVANFLMLLTERISFIRISPNSEIGSSLCINHGFGVIIGGSSILGDHCTIQQGVTIGGNFNKERKSVDGSTQEYPVIGNYVHLGAGCAILGPINIGNSVIIGANATITTDIQDYSIVVGGRSESIKNIDPNNEKHRQRFRTVIQDQKND
jgi:serine O-acetyltransferase